jgi:predicted DNA-binding WGR domain protein
MRKFTFIGGGSRKFWQIEYPIEIQGQWCVGVAFGRIGTSGQHRTKIFYGKSKWYADKYYDDKISEKIHKGYVETGKTSVKKNVVTYTPDYVETKPKPCSHDNLTRAGNTWTCNACKSAVEFDKTLKVEEVEVVTKVRRFFDLSAKE